MIIDLCCGFGRWDTKEECISIDIDKKTKPIICADVRYLPLRSKLKPKLCHASPPCTYFSQMRLCNGKGYSPLGIAEGLELVAACFRAFDWLEPKMWTLENPRGLLRRIIPTRVETEYSTFAKTDNNNDHKAFLNKKTDFWTSHPRSLRLALIPKDVRQKILDVADLHNRGI